MGQIGHFDQFDQKLDAKWANLTEFWSKLIKSTKTRRQTANFDQILIKIIKFWSKTDQAKPNLAKIFGQEYLFPSNIYFTSHIFKNKISLPAN